MDEQCQHCVFWQADGNVTGDCRRFPPHVSEQMTKWPRTPAGGWCGEFEEAEEEIQEPQLREDNLEAVMARLRAPVSIEPIEDGEIGTRMGFLIVLAIAVLLAAGYFAWRHFWPHGSGQCTEAEMRDVGPIKPNPDGTFNLPACSSGSIEMQVNFDEPAEQDARSTGDIS